MAAFKNRRARKRVVERPCDMCGRNDVDRDAAHIVDEQNGTGGSVDGDWNALSLCPTCHRVFDDKLRPKLYRALARCGAIRLPASWEQSNKQTRPRSGDA